MKADKYCIDGSKKLNLKKMSTNAKSDGVEKEAILKKTEKNLKKMVELQDAFYADGREGLVVILQALDAAGKDGTIKHVMTALNPQGVTVHSFKAPTSEELKHDYLWRASQCLPRRGEIAILNRSYYEDVLVTQLHELQKGYKMAPRVLKESTEEFYKKRYRQIRDFEQYLYENSYRVVKIFLNVSKDTQKKRFLERIDLQEKNWKFSSSDIAERESFDKYQELFQTVINETSTEESPWYVVPADQKWYTRYLVSEIVTDQLAKCCHEYPKLPDGEKEKLAQAKATLLAEKD